MYAQLVKQTQQQKATWPGSDSLSPFTLIRTCCTCKRGVFGAQRARANVVSANSRLAKKRGDSYAEEYVRRAGGL